MGCNKNFTSEADFNPDVNFSDYPPYLCPPNNLTGYEDIGTRVMEVMLLTQYTNSPNLKEYIGAFVKEVDILKDEIYKVELGRYIANAEGAQLDVIGIILQQSRSLSIPKVWFGFVGAPNVAGMADEATPSGGGIFKSEGEFGFTLTPLDDITYRKVLLCRGFVLSQPHFDINTIYKAIETLLGKIPNHIKLFEVAPYLWEIQLDSTVVSSYEASIISAVNHWFIPMTYQLSINLI